MGKGGNSPIPAPSVIAGNAGRAAGYGIGDALIAALPSVGGPAGGVVSAVLGSILGDVVADPLANFLGGAFGGQGPAARVDGETEPVQPQGSSGLFGPMTPDRYETIMSLLAASMAGANQSNSPAAAFLAPIIGSYVGSRAKDQLSAGSTQQIADLLGRPLTPQERQAMAIVDDPGSSEYLRSIARTMLPKAAAPSGGSARRSGGSRPASSSEQRPRRLYGEIVAGPDGTPGKYDGSGKWWPLDPPGGGSANPATTGQPVVSAMPENPPDPVLPMDPGAPSAGNVSGLSDEDLLSLYR